MTVTVKHRVVEITYEGGATGPKSAEAWWAECETCGKRSRLFLVGLVSAPAMDAEIERDSHQCNLENHFSTTEQAWAGFWSTIANHGPLDAIRRHIDQAVRGEAPTTSGADPFGARRSEKPIAAAVEEAPPSERLAKAIELLEAFRDETASSWTAGSDDGDWDGVGVASILYGDNGDHLGQMREPVDARVAATLHHTIRAQIAILQAAAKEGRAGVDRWLDHQSLIRPAIELADALLGDPSSPISRTEEAP